MDIRFRQGVVALPTNSLQKNDLGGVDIVINGASILATIASGTANYTISETRSVVNAWGPFSGTSTVYLYWQIDSRTGDLVRKSTLRTPVTSAVEPTQLIDTLWFDVTANKTKRWNGSVWEAVLVVFAGTLNSGSILIPSAIGTQVGINAVGSDVGFSSGYVLRDGLGNALRTSNAGEFLTSETPILSVDTGSLVKFEGSQLVATAATPLAAFDIVYLSGSSLVSKASGLNLSNDNTRAPIGMVTASAVANTQVALVTAGKKVVNESWNWPVNQIGRSIYCDASGQATTQKPAGYKHVRVGVICATNSIMLTFDWETDVVAPIVSDSGGGSSFTLNSEVPLQITGTAIKTISMPRATIGEDGYMHAADMLRISSLEGSLASKADVTHVHAITNVSGLSTALAGKADMAHSHVITDVAGLTTVVGNVTALQTEIVTKADSATVTASLATKSDVGHGHVITDVAGLSTALVGKADVAHVHAISGVTGLTDALVTKADVVHAHAISEVTGLTTALADKADASDVATALADKADIVHVHAIAGVTGLTDALADKADVVHAHAISEVTGLTDTLADKADAVHVHTIAGVTGLTDALADKADVVHVHAISEVTGLTTALADKADSATVTTALADKANIVHAHAISEVTGLSAALAALGSAGGALVVPIIVAGSDETTPIAAVGERVNFRMPRAGVLQEVHINIATSSALTSDATIGITVNGSDLFVGGVPATIASGTFSVKKLFADLQITSLQTDDLIVISVLNIGTGNLIGLKATFLVQFGSVSSTEALASDALPLQDGTALPGVGVTWARGDHVHPTDTTRASQAATDAAFTSMQGQIDTRFTAVNTLVATTQASLQLADANTITYVDDTRDLIVDDLTALTTRVGVVEGSAAIASADIITINDRLDNLPVTNVTLVSVSRALTAADDGDVLEITADGVVLTVPEALPAQFGCAVMVTTGTASVAVAGSVTLNGATTTLTRASTTNPMFAIVRRTSTAFGYTVTGS